MVYIRDTKTDVDKKTAVALGNFDGLHSGHQKLMQELKQVACDKHLLSMVFSFYPHPKVVLDGELFVTIMTSEEKLYILEQMGIDMLWEYPFSKEFAQMPAEQFVADVLVGKLKSSVVVVGENFRFGRKNAGDVGLLVTMGRSLGFEVRVVDNYQLGDLQVSSTEIRKRLLAKDFPTVQQLLTRPYFAMGVIAEGRKVGRTIGFPTVNITPDQTKLLPPNGVYATRVLLGGVVYDAVTNVGVKPTYGDLEKNIETHIFEYTEEAYGQKMIVYFYLGIRDEKKFSSVNELKHQISSDILAAKAFFENL